MMALAKLLDSDDVIGIVARETQVRLVNISVSGCLLESAHRFEVGTTGVLEVAIGDANYSDAVRVSRVQPVFGGGVAWHIGMEFLWTSHPGSWSLRRMVNRLRKDIVQQTLQAGFVVGRVM
jgi:hypothetical protein